jgi:hypothetical protein
MRVLLLCWLLAQGPAARAAETLVSSPAELADAIAGAAAGDELVIRDGSRSDWGIALKANGKPGQPIVLRPQTPGGVVFQGRTRITIEGAHLVVSGFVFDGVRNARGVPLVEFIRAESCRLTDCAFLKCGDAESPFTRTINLAHGSKHNRVDHCFMTGTLSMGMGVVVRDDPAGRGNTDNRFDHNHFKAIVRRSANGQEPVQLGQDQSAHGNVSARAIVEFNLFEQADGDSEIISNKSADNIIRHNTMRDSRAGLCLRGGRNVRVEGNWFLRTEGMRVFGEGHVIVNNHFMETSDGILLPAGQYRGGHFADRATSGSYQRAERVLVVHNTIVNPKRSGIELGRDRGQSHEGVVKNQMPADIEIACNLVTGRSGKLFVDHGAEAVRWTGNIGWPAGQAAIGIETPGIRKVDPALVQHDGWLRLSSGSPARDTGPKRDGLENDIDGQPRDDRPDAGCDEVSAAPITWRPLTPADVGPRWRRDAANRDSTSVRPDIEKRTVEPES